MAAGRRRRPSKDEFANLPPMAAGLASANGKGRGALALDIERPEGSQFDPWLPTGPVDGLSEVGVTGLRRNSGIVDEELLLELRGERGRRQIRMMIDEDPIIGGFLFAIEMLCRQVDWNIEPASPDDEDVAIADFIKSCLMEDMSHTWQDTLAEIISMLPWGWAYLEIVWKRRNGEHPEDGTQDSMYDDGRIGVRKLSIRAQETLQQWIFDDNGGVRAMIQAAAPNYHLVEIPIEKALLFRTTSRKGNPEGRSILRNAYRPWFFKRNIERIEAIGVERDLAGFPIAWIPPAYLMPGATNDQKMMTAAFKQMVTNVRRDEQEGAVFPLAYDAKGQKLFDFTLLNSGGARVFNTTEIIQRYDQRIAASVLADFILLGSQSVGSFSLASSKTSLFSVAIGTYMDAICDVINRYLIVRLMRLNGWMGMKPPHLTHGDIESTDPADLARYITAIAGAGMPLFPSPNGDLEKYLLHVVGLPVSEDMVGGDAVGHPTTKGVPGAAGALGAPQPGEPGGPPTDGTPAPPGGPTTPGAGGVDAMSILKNAGIPAAGAQIIDTTKMAEYVAATALSLMMDQKEENGEIDSQRYHEFTEAMMALEYALVETTSQNSEQLATLTAAVLDAASRPIHVNVDGPGYPLSEPIAATEPASAPVPRATRKTVKRDSEGRIESVTEEVLEYEPSSITMAETPSRRRRKVKRDAEGRIESITEEVE